VLNIESALGYCVSRPELKLTIHDQNCNELENCHEDHVVELSLLADNEAL